MTLKELPRLQVTKGEKMAWDALSALDPALVCKNALTSFDHKPAIFTIKCFGSEFYADTKNRTLTSEDGKGKTFPGKFMEYLRLALLWYLSSAKEIPATGKLIKPSDVKGGHIYVHGTHQLPLNDLAERYKTDASGFVDRGRSYGAELVVGIGDAAIRLYPLPRIPVTMVLRLEDKEEGFPSEVRLFFDSTLDFHVAPDIGWSLAMCCCMALLHEA